MANITLKINGNEDQTAGFITWTPVPLNVENNDISTIELIISNRPLNGSRAKTEFYTDLISNPSDDLRIKLNPGEKRELFIAGKFQDGQLHNGASPYEKDVLIEAKNVESDEVESSISVMIRVRKNANHLSGVARKNFTDALAAINGAAIEEDSGSPGAGKGVYVTDFVEMHIDGASLSEHGDSHFLPWHRLYLLDLERKLQEVNPTVTLPYWKFDEKAENVFQKDFMGQTQEIPRDTRAPRGGQDSGPGTPLAEFSADNNLSKWQIKNRNGINRAARFDTQNEPANGAIFYDPMTGGRIDFRLITENETLALGGGRINPDDATFGRRRTGFARMEGTPHGAAHVSFNGPINSVPIAPQDPLFFLLHCNVDRLWAKWQLVFDRDDSSDTRTYPYQNAGDANPWKIISAEQWPWVDGRSMPGGLMPPGSRKENFTQSPNGKNFPNNVPTLENSIDPFGNRANTNQLGFAYDDIPYNPAS